MCENCDDDPELVRKLSHDMIESVVNHFPDQGVKPDTAVHCFLYVIGFMILQLGKIVGVDRAEELVKSVMQKNRLHQDFMDKTTHNSDYVN